MTVWRHHPTLPMLEHDGRWWVAHDSTDPAWIILGHAPTPRSSWQGFWHHWHHGRLMRYPAWNVLKFAWTHRQSWPKT